MFLETRRRRRMKNIANNFRGNDAKMDSIERDLYLRKIALGEVEGEVTGYS